MIYNTTMSFKETKNFIIGYAKKEVLYKIEFDKKQRLGDFSKQELFCLSLFDFCRCLYYDIDSPVFFEKLAEFGVKSTSDGLYYLDSDFGQGLFCNANAMIKNVYCKEEECFSSAYLLASSYNGKISIKSGVANPYHVANGFLHAVCEFEKDGTIFVFDGANYLIMEKELYYKLFDFHSVQEISKKRLTLDMDLISQGILKKEERLSLASDSDVLKRHFDGFGFLLYLYDRKASLAPNISPGNKHKRNMKTFEELNFCVKRCKEELQIKDIDDEQNKYI